MPEIQSRVLTLADYREIDLRPYAQPFSMEEEALNKELMRIRSRYGTMEQEKAIAEGDIVALCLQGSTPRFQKDRVQVRVGKGLLDHELEQKLIGLSLHQQAALTVGEETVQVTVLDIRRRHLAPLTDEAVASWNLEGIATVEGLKWDIIARAKSQYVEDMSESLAIFLSSEVCRMSTFEMDAEELEAARLEGEAMARDMLRSSGLNPDTATDEEVQEATGGRTRQEHFDFIEGICMEEIKSCAIGALLWEKENVPLPTEAAYEKALEECAEGMGLSLEEAKNVLTRPRYIRQQAANYFFNKLEAYCIEYLTKEN